MAKAKTYMIVSKDEYELPIAFADSLKELSEISGYNFYTLKNCCDKQRDLKLKSRGKFPGRRGKVITVKS